MFESEDSAYRHKCRLVYRRTATSHNLGKQPKVINHRDRKRQLWNASQHSTKWAEWSYTNIKVRINTLEMCEVHCTQQHDTEKTRHSISKCSSWGWCVQGPQFWKEDASRSWLSVNEVSIPKNAAVSLVTPAVTWKIWGGEKRSERTGNQRTFWTNLSGVFKICAWRSDRTTRRNECLLSH